MEDIHQLLSKFAATAKTFEQHVTAKERRQAASLGPLATPEAIDAAIQWHEGAIVEVTTRLQKLDEQASATREPAEATRLATLRAELVQELPALRRAIDALRQRLDPPPMATR